MAQIQTIDWSTDPTQSITLLASLVPGTTGPGPIEIVFANPAEGITYNLEIIESTSVYSVPSAVTWNADILFSGGSPPSLTLRPGGVDVFTFVYLNNSYTNTSYSLNVLPS